MVGQFIFFTIFVIALLAGLFAYFAPLQKSTSPIKFIQDNSGYTRQEMLSRKRTQQFNMTTDRGFIQIRRQTDNLALEQDKFSDMLQDQQRVLNDAGKDAEDIMLMAQREGGKGNKDMLRLRALASDMQNEQRLLAAHGQDLITLNDQLTMDRQWISNQIDLPNINDETSLRTFQQRYMTLEKQAAIFSYNVMQHHQAVHDQIAKIQDQLNNLVNNAAYDSAVQQQSVKDSIQRMLGKEREDMTRLADSRERNRDLLRDTRQNLEDSKELLKDSLQHSQDLIEQERQKAEDQKWINQQRTADQMQRLRDQQNR